MIRIFLDFETFYDHDYTLKQLSPIEYILNPRWETLACAVAIEHDDPFLLQRDDVAAFLREIRQPYMAITHNALFDACVLSFRYGIHPSALFCTLSMARALIYHKIPNGRLSLANVLDYLQLPRKQEFIAKMIGKRWKDLQADPGLMMLFTGYAVNDVSGCREIFFKLRQDFPRGEAIVMDRLIRMATKPVLQVDVARLGDYRQDIQRHKRELLSRVTEGGRLELMSNVMFAELLLRLGVEPPRKASPSNPANTTYAFARTDKAFTDLLEHDNPDVQALVAARLGIKTTIEETRSTRLIRIGMCTNAYMGAPCLPVPLKYSGAHTHRYSGDWQLNMQNLSARKSKELRTAIVAPPGFTIVAVDAAQIEARIVAWLSWQRDLLDMFAKGEDTYKAFASVIFSLPVTQVSKNQRFVGKTCILGLGFGMSAKRLYFTITTLAREQNIDIAISMTDCEEWVRTYRRQFASIVSCWDDMNLLIMAMARGQSSDCSVGPCEVDGTAIILPSGLRLYYDNLKLEDNEYWYTQAQFRKKLYGGKLLENITQALDRQHVVEAGLRTELRARKAKLTDPRVLLNVHDENVHCVPDDEAPAMAQIALEEMRRGNSWSNGLPLAAEVKLGKNYGEMEEWKP